MERFKFIKNVLFFSKLIETAIAHCSMHHDSYHIYDGVKVGIKAIKKRTASLVL